MKWPSHSSILLNAYQNFFYYTKCDAYNLLLILNLKMIKILRKRLLLWDKIVNYIDCDKK